MLALYQQRQRGSAGWKMSTVDRTREDSLAAGGGDWGGTSTWRAWRGLLGGLLGWVQNGVEEEGFPSTMVGSVGTGADIDRSSRPASRGRFPAR